ncbi:DUF3224 domain-containing protein [Nocardioides speluncae]|uniref:DUF3224 domain-containing protein n=1 Tax=Nocardioides speluncae TaxID=2670337 RepID=UPI000D698464|nr:DUF3224 domain-containing protein [Nocardioides speluncae]
MATTATGTVENKSWDQTPYADVDGATTIAVATGQDRYHGDIEGDAEWRGLTIAEPDGSGTFHSVQRMTCTIAGSSGSFVLRMSGVFDPEGSRADWEVVPGSGTGELAGITGTGGFDAEGESATYTLAYSLGDGSQ